MIIHGAIKGTKKEKVSNERLSGVFPNCTHFVYDARTERKAYEDLRESGYGRICTNPKIEEMLRKDVDDYDRELDGPPCPDYIYCTYICEHYEKE
jgi:hypothetical protein